MAQSYRMRAFRPSQETSDALAGGDHFVGRILRGRDGQVNELGGASAPRV